MVFDKDKMPAHRIRAMASSLLDDQGNGRASPLSAPRLMLPLSEGPAIGSRLANSWPICFQLLALPGNRHKPPGRMSLANVSRHNIHYDEVTGHILEQNPCLSVVLRVSVRGSGPVTEGHIDEAAYYHARAADMMAKAQAAPTKATRAAYLNLARVWARKAADSEKEWRQSRRQDAEEVEAKGAEQKNQLPADRRGNF